MYVARGTPGMKHLISGSRSSQCSTFSFFLRGRPRLVRNLVPFHHTVTGRNPTDRAQRTHRRGG